MLRRGVASVTVKRNRIFALILLIIVLLAGLACQKKDAAQNDAGDGDGIPAPTTIPARCWLCADLSDLFRRGSIEYLVSDYGDQAKGCHQQFD